MPSSPTARPLLPARRPHGMRRGAAGTRAHRRGRAAGAPGHPRSRPAITHRAERGTAPAGPTRRCAYRRQAHPARPAHAPGGGRPITCGFSARTRRWTAPFPEPRGHGALTGLVSRISTVALISASTAQAASTAKPALVAWVPAWAAVAPARSDEAAAAAATVPATATPSAAPV